MRTSRIPLLIAGLAIVTGGLIYILFRPSEFVFFQWIRTLGFGQTLTFHMDEPFCAGLGFASHTPDKSDTAVLSDVFLENAAGKVR